MANATLRLYYTELDFDDLLHLNPRWIVHFSWFNSPAQTIAPRALITDEARSWIQGILLALSSSTIFRLISLFHSPSRDATMMFSV
jgi:hypothetical protein